MTPPRWAERLLLLCLPPGLVRDSVVGDMEEELRARALRTSPAGARRWYARQAVGVSLRYLARRLSGLPAPTPSHDPDPRGASMLRSLLVAWTQALRSLSHARAFVALAALTLALGVGATTAIFSVVDGVLLRPLPYPRADQLVVLRYVQQGQEMANHSEPEIGDLSREIGAFSAVAAYHETSLVLGSADEPERVPVVLASAPLLPLLDVPPLVGRFYAEDEDRPDGDRVVVLSHGLWMRLFGGDQGAIGGTVVLSDVPHTVIGVMPEGFAYPRPEAHAWAPLRLDPANPWTRNNHYLQVVARLADGASLDAAAAELDALGARSTEAYPEFYSERVTFRPRLLREELVGDVRAPLLLLMGAVVGVLLIASVNTASLFLARGETRRGEIAVRTALGAGRGRVAAQLLGESVLVAALAGAAGVGLAYAGVAALKGLAPPELPRLEHVGVDGRVLLFGLLTALVTGLLFGLLPVVQGWRSDVRDVLGAAGRGGIGGRRGGRFRRGLVVAQLSLATVLALGAGLLLRSFGELRRVDLGFRPEGVLLTPLSPPVSAVAPDADAVAWYEALETRVAALPGVTAVGSALRVPLAGGHDNYSIQVEGRVVATIGDAPSPGMQWATPGYFDALGIPLRRGRLFTRQDHADAALVAVVNERLARELWPGEDALGKRVRMFNEASPWMEVVGVVADVKHYGVRAEASTKLYVPHAQGYLSGYYSPNAMTVFARSDGDPAALAAPIRALVRELGPAVPIGSVRTMEEVAGAALSRERFTLLLLAVFSGVALLLAAVGVYGLVSQVIVSRTREIGVRMAIGARRSAVAREVLREALAMALQGAAIGLLAGLALTGLLRTILYEVSPRDPWTFAVAVPVLIAAAALASLLPAIRAAGLDPVRALREG